MSEPRDSSSPSVSSANHFRIPDDSMIIRYESTDPTNILENPRHHFGDEVYERVVSEKLGGVLVELMEKYQKLSQVNSNITVMNTKHLLQQDELKVADIYDLVDKFYVDVPDINCVNSSWVTKENLPLLIEKQNLHMEIKKGLVLLQTTLDVSKQYEPDHPHECEDDDVCAKIDDEEDPEVTDKLTESKQTKTKPKKNKNKKKTT